jgi:hypothetical protein
VQHGPVRVATARRGPELDGRDDARRPNADRLGEGHARLLIKTGPSDPTPRVSTEIANKGTDSPNKVSDTRITSPSRMCRFNSGVRTRLAVPEDASGLQSQLPNATLTLIHVAHSRAYVPQAPPRRSPRADARAHARSRTPGRRQGLPLQWALKHWHGYASHRHRDSQARSCGRGSEAANHGPGVASPMYKPGAGPDQIFVLASPFKVTIGALRLHRLGDLDQFGPREIKAAEDTMPVGGA